MESRKQPPLSTFQDSQKAELLIMVHPLSYGVVVGGVVVGAVVAGDVDVSGNGKMN